MKTSRTARPLPALLASLALLASGSFAHAAQPDEELLPEKAPLFQMAPLASEFMEWHSSADALPLEKDAEESRIDAKAPQTPPERIDYSHLKANPPAGEGGVDLPTSFDLRGKQNVGGLLADSKAGFGTTAWAITKNITRLQDANILGHVDEDNRDAAKLAIMQHGAVKVSYYSPDPDESSEYYCTYPQCAYYCPGSASKKYCSDASTAYFSDQFAATKRTNHTALLVGWDDNFPRTKFGDSGMRLPQKNGAWLVRNSWGTDWGDGGYFWLSYEQYISGAVALVAKEADSSLRHYGHDTRGHTDSVTGEWAANVFRAQDNEAVQEIAFYTTDNNTKYEAWVYDLGDALPTESPVQGAPVAQVSGTIPHAGYHRVELPTPANVDAGHYFSVVVKAMAGGHSYPTAIESTAAGAKVSAGESWFSEDGESWNNASASAHATIKAFTTSTQILPVTTKWGFEVVDGKAYTCKDSDCSSIYYFDAHADGNCIVGLPCKYNLYTNEGRDGVSWTLVDPPTRNFRLNQQDGYVYGTPTNVGKHTFKVTATKGRSNDTKKLKFTVDALYIPMMGGYDVHVVSVGQTVNLSLPLVVSKYPITWSIDSCLLSCDSLPPGLELVGNMIRGTVKESARGKSYLVKGKAKNEKGSDSRYVMEFYVEPSVKITVPRSVTSSNGRLLMPEGTVGKKYEQVKFRAERPISGSVTWDLKGAPEGLYISEQGTVYGTPKTAVTNKEVKVSVSYCLSAGAGHCHAERYDSKTVYLTIKGNPNQQPPVITTATQLPDGRVGQKYYNDNGGKFPLSASPAGNLKWESVTEPPKKMFVSEAGNIYGTPEVSGTFDWTIKATDKNSNLSTQKTFKIKINPSSSGGGSGGSGGSGGTSTRKPVITTKCTCGEWPNGEKGVPFCMQLEASGSPTSWKLYSGKMPKGLRLEESTGKIFGTPQEITSAVDGRFEVIALNSAGKSEPKLCHIAIREKGKNSCGRNTCTPPSGGGSGSSGGGSGSSANRAPVITITTQDGNATQKCTVGQTCWVGFKATSSTDVSWSLDTPGVPGMSLRALPNNVATYIGPLTAEALPGRTIKVVATNSAGSTTKLVTIHVVRP